MGLLAAKFDTKSTVMTPQEERYWLHALKADPIMGSFIKSQAKMNDNFSKEIFDLPVCEKCEKLALHHKDGVMCMTCGHWSKGKTHKVKQHIAGGMYR